MSDESYPLPVFRADAADVAGDVITAFDTEPFLTAAVTAVWAAGKREARIG
jgi:hypothetical protein